MINFFENTITIQFTHRVLGTATVAAILLVWFFNRLVQTNGRMSRLIGALALAAVVQAVLGISTLVLVVPIPLAAGHQAGGMVLFSAAIIALHATRGRR